MPPQQSERLLDFGDDGFDFGAHSSDVRDWMSDVNIQDVV
jgi:hypothetical protein